MGNISLFHEPLSVSVTKGTNFDVTLYKYHSVGQNQTKIFLKNLIYIILIFASHDLLIGSLNKKDEYILCPKPSHPIFNRIRSINATNHWFLCNAT